MAIATGDRASPQPPRLPPALTALSRHPLWVLTVLFVVSRAVFFAAGVRFDLYPINQSLSASVAWQVLDPHLLRTAPVESLWYLHSQPPLFNLLSSLLLHLPAGARQFTAALMFSVLGLATTLSVYSVMVALRVPRTAAFVVAFLLMVDPATVLFENWLFYAYPTAALLIVAAYSCFRYFRTGGWWWGFGFFLALGAVVLLNSSFQIEWLLVVLVWALILGRRRWRSVAAVAAVPLVLVAGWYLKDAVQFGTYTTSSWFGMNLARTTVGQAPGPVLKALIKDHTLDQLAAIAPFAPVTFYSPRFVPAPHTGIPVLDQPYKQVPAGTNILLKGAHTNFNNLIYVEISRRYLHDDLAYIRAEPGRFADTVAKAGSLWFVSADDYGFLSANRSRIAGWSNLYDTVVEWQPASDLSPQLAAIRGQGPNPGQISYATVAVFVVALLGGPLAAWRRRRDIATAMTLSYLWFTTLYSVVGTSLVEFGENERFRFELGPLPVVLATVTVVTLLRRRSPDVEDQGPFDAPRTQEEPPHPAKTTVVPLTLSTTAGQPGRLG